MFKAFLIYMVGKQERWDYVKSRCKKLFPPEVGGIDTELCSPASTHPSPSAQRESPCCSIEVSQHCWLAPQWFVRPKCTIVSLLVICQTVSSFNHTGQTSSEKGRVCYELGLINIWVWLLRTVLLNSYFIIKTYPRQGQQNTSVWPRPKYRDGLGPKASYYS